MEPLVILLIIVTIILTTLLSIVGIQIILMHRDLRHTIQRVNSTLDSADQLLANVSSPFTRMGGMIEGVKSGLKVAEMFVKWVKKNADNEEQEDE